MPQAQFDQLARLSELPADSIGENENNVKYRFIIPFLEVFGYEKNLDFEHAAQGNRLDILIDKISDHTIVVEAKSYGRNLDDYLPQLKRYCDEKRPILAIISNGEDIRFYSPLWKKPNFADTLIYSIARRQLSDRKIVERLEVTLSKQFLEDSSIVKHIEEREKELDEVNRQLRIVEKTYVERAEELKTTIAALEKQIVAIQSSITAQRIQIEDLERQREDHLRAIEVEHLVRLVNERQVVSVVPSPVRSSLRRPRGRKGYEQLSDYLLPVVCLMNGGVRHNDAFRRIAEKLDVEYSTAAAQCTTRLRLSTDQFVELVESKKIKTFLKERFQDRVSEIEQNL